MIIPPELFETRSLHNSPKGKDICQLLSAAICNADAGQYVRNKVLLDKDNLNICDLTINLAGYQRIFVIGIGKAVVPMAEAALSIFGDRIASGLVITKVGYAGSNHALLQNRIAVLQAAHPIPDQRNVFATSKLFALAKHLSPRDLVICLISGGGSVLMLRPSAGLTLPDIQDTTSLLLSSGATIEEINTVRKHIDDLKGGGLAKLLIPSTVISLILSDVIGDNLDMVASGPTIADPTTYSDALKVLNKYHILDQVPASIKKHIFSGVDGVIPDTVKPDDLAMNHVHNILIGNNTQASLAAVQAANRLGFITYLYPKPILGEASVVGSAVMEYAKPFLNSYASIEHPSCVIAGGETTVTVMGPGARPGSSEKLIQGKRYDFSFIGDRRRRWTDRLGWSSSHQSNLM
jgi:glycerate 2-kinase